MATWVKFPYPKRLLFLREKMEAWRFFGELWNDIFTNVMNLLYRMNISMRKWDLMIYDYLVSIWQSTVRLCISENSIYYRLVCARLWISKMHENSKIGSWFREYGRPLKRIWEDPWVNEVFFIQATPSFSIACLFTSSCEEFINFRYLKRLCSLAVHFPRFPLVLILFFVVSSCHECITLGI